MVKANLPLGSQKWLKNTLEETHTFTDHVTSGKVLFLCLHFLIYKIKMITVAVSRKTVIVVRLKYGNSH